MTNRNTNEGSAMTDFNLTDHQSRDEAMLDRVAAALSEHEKRVAQERRHCRIADRTLIKEGNPT